MLAIVLVALSLFNLDSAQGQEECGGPLSDTPFDDILDVAAYYSRCTFPGHKFNVSCLLSSCPSLKGVCPMTSTRSINQTSLTSAVSILNTCIGQTGLICNINMSHTPMVQLGWTTAQLIPVNVANGTAILHPGTGYVENLSHATFTLRQNISGPIILSVQAPNIIGKGNFQSMFNISATSFLNPLKGIIPGLNTLHTPDMKGILNINASFTLSINLTTPTPTIKTFDDLFNLNLVYSNFISTNGVALDQTLVNLINQGMNTFMKASVLHSTVNNFLSTYAVMGLQAAQLNCP